MIPIHCSRSRIPRVVAARHAAWARMHLEGMRLVEIARACGVDPTTVAQALSKQRARKEEGYGRP